ncbi:MAG: bifunctional 4-hydroxy-2-oxoglutarate aldolase/2-dehydro-3-deoxy-phosphogluconate aldolase [Weeping tea tree witches'-broom phytoplasma]|uniref:bifunctional 4-hydroxy-2-oxoglutarate aldolase/2-dehydro-3-deoxy-phosphogluconate aldolase n=1 Tax=Candidatus Phytoplasma melaleucae TaxID=2982630 RepID=UPI002939FE7A|nr:bifunctional 4-hydroxy-2-oxoglutarate aldolase/2-dehydro-3-deoxy-phosphogluconate aldolase [Weeping tea tree witches'-broom phytoplasma]
MKSITNIIQNLKQSPLSVIVRTKKFENACRILKNTLENGFSFAEVTLTIPNAYTLIEETSRKYPQATIGAGTVLTLKEAQKAIHSGAEYLVSPVYNEDILKWALEKNILYIPGVMTVNEMYYAFQKGASLLKVYPVSCFSPETLKLISNPFPYFKILATGGVDLNNIISYFKAGVWAVGITGVLGSDEHGGLVDEQETASLAIKYVNIVKHITTEREREKHLYVNK